MPPKLPHASLPRRRLQVTQVLQARDFTGGLNLVADAFTLAPNEVPDVLNCDLGDRGGFRQRGGVTALNSTLSTGVPKSIFKWGKAGSADQIITQQGNSLYQSTGGDFTAITMPDALATTGIMRAANMDGVTLIQRNAEQVGISYDGTTATALGVVFNDVLTAPAKNSLIKAKYITTHGGYTWIANTIESGTTFANRVRFSFPNNGRDWRTNDYIDIDIGVDGDQITGLLPLQDRLLVFKQNHTYAITGFDPQTFAVVPISHEVGAVSQEACAASEHTAYFFSWPQGVMAFDGHNLHNVFVKLQPLIYLGTIPASNNTAITLGWLNSRLWVSVPTGASTTPNATYVLDPQLDKGKGAWTRFDIPCGPMFEWKTPSAATRYLVCHPTLKRVIKVESRGVGFDNYGTGNVNIAAYFLTAWFDPDGVSTLKRWKRADFVLDADNSGTFSVDVHTDYDPTSVKQNFSFAVTSLGTGFVWGANWGSANWTGAASSGREFVFKAPTISARARAVQLKITAISNPSAPWSLNALSFKYMPKRVR